MNKIILIGGPPRCGKTTLAQKIAKASGITWISTDALDDVVKRYVSEDEIVRLFPKTDLRRKSDGSNDVMYATFSVEDIVDAYRVQAETVHKAIESFVACADKEGWGCVIEGYHVTPRLIAKLTSAGLTTSSAILISVDAKKAVTRSIESSAKSDWLRDNTENQGTFSKVVAMIDLYNKKITQEAEEFGMTVFDTSNDFQDKLKEISELLKQ